jgi:choline monooxygenase
MSLFFVDADISKAKTLSTDFYLMPEYFEETKKQIFNSSWQYIGHEDLVKDKGDCFPFTLLPGFIDEPLLLTRDLAGKIHCLSNVCTHRGAILVNKICHSKNLKCSYHGRMFQLDGSFLSMPEFRQVKNFPSPSDSLHTLPLFQWVDVLFTTLDEQQPANLILKDMMDRVSWLPLSEFKFEKDGSKDYYVNAHWAHYCENYLEGFHIPFVHAGLNAVINYGEYTTELFPYSSLQMGIAKSGEESFTPPLGSIDHGKKIAAYYFWVFPNMMFNFYPWGLSVNVVRPIAIDKTKVSYYTYIWKQEKYNRGAGSDLDKVEMEDEAIVQSVQAGIRSKFYEHGRYSVSREQGTHHFHRLITQFMN